jgi:predicted peptidase
MYNFPHRSTKVFLKFFEEATMKKSKVFTVVLLFIMLIMPLINLGAQPGRDSASAPRGVVGDRGVRSPATEGARTVDDVTWHYLDPPNFQDTSKFVQPTRITAMGQLLEDGLVIGAIRILYSGDVDAGNLLPVNFQVPGRKVIHTYVNNTGERFEIAQKGRYLFAELLINEDPDSNDFKETSGNYKFDPRGGNWAIDLPMVSSIRQIDTRYSVDGRKIAPFNKITDDQYIEQVDEFVKGQYRDPATGITIKYNLYVPEGYRTKSGNLANLPLLFFLHGAGESGYDNRATVTAYRQAQEYITAQAQAETPCFLMIPQATMSEERGRGVTEEFGWYTYISSTDNTTSYTHPSKTLRAAINTMLNDVVPKYNIDTSRIYSAGHSMGGGGATAALIERPDVFAASASFASAAMYSDEMLNRIKDKPVFFTMAEDEPNAIISTNMPPMMDQLERLGVNMYRSIGDNAWDAALRGEEAQKEAEDTIARAKAAGATMIYIEFMKGSVVNDAHHSHRASFENAGIRQWLFTQRLSGGTTQSLTEQLRASGTHSEPPSIIPAPTRVGVWGVRSEATEGKQTVDDITWNYLDTPNFQDRSKFVWPEKITALGQIMEDGLVVGAIRVQYSGEINAGTLLPLNYRVPGRKVIHTYVNNTGKRFEIAQKGTYVFVELLTNEAPDSNEFKEISGNYQFYPGGSNSAIDLPIAVALRQADTKFSADGRTIAPFNKKNDDQYIELVDEFLQGQYRDPATGITIRYNLYVPEGYRSRSGQLANLPLLFFLHGGGESGYDNRATLTAYRQAQEYITPQAQSETPCFLMIPQCPMTEERSQGVAEESGWYTYITSPDGTTSYTHPSKSLRAAINTMLNDVVPRYNIDTNRIYVAGHSMGGGGASAALVERPDVFAAGASFASVSMYSDEMINRIRNKPIFFTMAENESISRIRNNMPPMMDQLERLGIGVYRSVGDIAWDAALRGEEAQKQAENTITRARRLGATMIYIEFMKGSVVNDAHHSHRASFENAGIRHWLFEQRLK